MNTLDFATLSNRVKGTNRQFPSLLLSLDPGETTGWATFKDGKLHEWGQIPTLGDWAEIRDLILRISPTYIVCENYRVYEHKLERHANSEVFTLRLLGVIEYLCWEHEISLIYQMAAVAKTFCTDARLKEWDFWQPGMKHARDAIRHGCYFLIFNKGY